MFTPEQRLSVLTHWSAAIKNSAMDSSITTENARLTSVRTTPIGLGFSGGAVYRVDDGDDVGSNGPSETRPSWALKAWPPTTPAQRIMRIASIVRAAAPHCSLLAPPLARDDTDVAPLGAHGSHWELARWIPGSPLPADATADAIAHGGEAIARAHAAMNRDGRSSPPPVHAATPPVPRCITDRMTRIHCVTPFIDRITGQLPGPDELSERLAGQLVNERRDEPASVFDCSELARLLIEAAAWLTRAWPVMIPQLVERLRQHGRDRERLASCWVLRDVHREHILFAEDRSVQGILDYDAVDLDSPAADLARWAGDFDAAATPFNQAAGRNQAAGSPEQSPLHAAVAGYRRVRSFSQCEWELAQTLIDTNRVGGLANWLAWLIAEDRQFTASAQQIQGRISHLIASNCRIC